MTITVNFSQSDSATFEEIYEDEPQDAQRRHWEAIISPEGLADIERFSGVSFGKLQELFGELQDRANAEPLETYFQHKDLIHLLKTVFLAGGLLCSTTGPYTYHPQYISPPC